MSFRLETRFRMEPIILTLKGKADLGEPELENSQRVGKTLTAKHCGLMFSSPVFQLRSSTFSWFPAPMR